MDEIEFTTEGVNLRERVTVLGEARTEERLIPYNELGTCDISLDTGGFVSLDELVEVREREAGGVESVELNIGSVPAIASDVQVTTRDIVSDEPPEVPRVDPDAIDYDSRRTFYQRLRDRPESQPADVRRIIYKEGELTRDEFDALVEEAGYASDGGGVSQSLVVLENVTDEIERNGRGDEQTISWVGSE